ncbi:MAG: hypothetical protein KDD53_12680, partial [Bdellovibrionales bacterium]|nr:hypothetical protein [Bdellovibrionales bacterium]
DTPEKISSMIRQLNLNAAADPKRIAGSKIPGSGVPRWAVIDENGDIVSSGAGLPSMGDDSSDRFLTYLRSKFKIG